MAATAPNGAGSDRPLAAAALSYAARGIPVFPLHTPVFAADGAVGCSCSRPVCRDQGKHPRTARGLYAATTDYARIAAWWRRWPDANIGARTGVTFDVCDLDGHAAGVTLRDRLRADGWQAWPAGPVAATGKGWHLLVAPTGRGNRVGVLPGVDWRGRGGYVVLPPALHPSGKRYRWLCGLEHQIPEAPGIVRALLDPAPAEGNGSATYLPPAAATRREAWAQAALRREAAAVARARPPDARTGSGGARAATLNRAAFKLGQLITGHPPLLDPETVRQVLTEAAARCGLDGREAARVIGCGLAAGRRRPRQSGG